MPLLVPMTEALQTKAILEEGCIVQGRTCFSPEQMCYPVEVELQLL